MDYELSSNTNRYEGEFKDGNRDGYGRMKYANGGIYEGEWKNDCEHGHGRYILAEGRWYEGVWVDGKMDGRVILYDHGRKYE